MRIWLAIRVFFKTLFNRDAAERIGKVLDAPALPAPAAEAKERKVEPKKTAPPKPARSEAITLLATLQREARFVDIVKEPLGQYSDAQIGAAARDVLRDCGTVLDRLFALQPIADHEEGAEIEVPSGFDPSRFRLTGKVSGEPPFQGRVVHQGWQATKCELPQWTGSAESALIVAPIEVEIDGQ